MGHLASDSFWAAYQRLPADVRALAGKNFALLKNDPHPPSLRFEKADKYWNVRIGLHYRALSKPVDGDFRRSWIGAHEDYDRLIGQISRKRPVRNSSSDSVNRRSSAPFPASRSILASNNAASNGSYQARNLRSSAVMPAL